MRFSSLRPLHLLRVGVATLAVGVPAAFLIHLWAIFVARELGPSASRER